MIVVAAFFLVWDEIFTQWGVWGFNPDYLTGVYLGSLPMEEVLFFICIPYACVFTYHALNELLGKPDYTTMHKWLNYIIIAASFLLAFIYKDRLYTMITFLFLAVVLLIANFSTYKQYLAAIYRGYFVIIPFFFISNGLLTGTAIADQVVWYNDAELIGRRMLTIPVEDMWYGFLLILLNVLGYEWLKSRKTVSV